MIFCVSEDLEIWLLVAWSIYILDVGGWEDHKADAAEDIFSTDWSPESRIR